MSREDKLRQIAELRNPAMGIMSHIQMLKGEKGDKGDTGDTGQQGIPGEKGERGDTGAHGERGLAGRDGRNGLDGADGRSGKDGRDGRDGKDAAAPKLESLIEAVVTELEKKPLSENVVTKDDLVKFLKRGGFRGGGDTVAAGSNITVTRANGITTIAAAGGAGTIYSDTLSGTIDGVNKIFTTTNNIALALAGYLANSIYQPGVDFTVTGVKQITYTLAPDSSLSGQPHWLSHT